MTQGFKSQHHCKSSPKGTTAEEKWEICFCRIRDPLEFPNWSAACCQTVFQMKHVVFQTCEMILFRHQHQVLLDISSITVMSIFSPHSIGNCNFHIEGRMQHESQKHVTSNKRTRTHSSDITYLLHKNSCNQQKRHSNQDTCDCTWKRCFCAWFQFFSGVLPILPDSTLLSNMKDTTVALISSPNAFVSHLCPMHCVFTSVKPSLVQRGWKRSFAPHLRACARST